MIYKIVQGNSFQLHILVRKIDLSKDFKRLVDFDMSKVDDIKVELSGCFGESVIVPSRISGGRNNVLVCDMPSSLDIGNYNVKVSWKMDNSDMVSIERNVIRIVAHNSQTKIPVGIVEGETSGMFHLRYYIVTDNISVCHINYLLDDISLSEQPAAVKNGSKLELELTPVEGFNIGVVKVIMDGNDITHEVYKDGKIVIPAVSGYVCIMANGDDNLYYYGATSAKDMSELDMKDLTKVVGDLADKSVTVTTTYSKQYVWFVSRVPLVFTQAGFISSFNTTKVGDLFFYWSDKLKAGTNTYNAKLK